MPIDAMWYALVLVQLVVGEHFVHTATPITDASRSISLVAKSQVLFAACGFRCGALPRLFVRV